jgi:hypothetical protein
MFKGNFFDKKFENGKKKFIQNFPGNQSRICIFVGFLGDYQEKIVFIKKNHYAKHIHNFIGFEPEQIYCRAPFINRGIH